MNIPQNNQNVRLYINRVSSLNYISLPVNNSYYPDIVVSLSGINELYLNSSFQHNCKCFLSGIGWRRTTLHCENYIAVQNNVNSINSPSLYYIVNDKLYVLGAEYMSNNEFYINGKLANWNEVVRDIEKETYSSIVNYAFYFRKFDSFTICN